MWVRKNKLLFFNVDNYSYMKRGRTAPKARTAPKRQKTTFARKQQQIVKPVVERKYFDATRPGVAIIASTTNWAGGELDPPVLLCLFAPVQGDDIFNRQSRKVQVLQLKISGQVGAPPQASTAAPNIAAIIRLAVVQDTQSNGAAFSAQQVFGATNANAEPTDMFQNPAFFGRYRVLKSTKFVMQDLAIADNTSAGGLATGGLAVLFKMNVKFKKAVTVHYNTGNTGTNSDIVDNSFHLIGICSNANLLPQIAYRCRTTFIDV